MTCDRLGRRGLLLFPACLIVSVLVGCRAAELVAPAQVSTPRITQYIALGDSISTDDYPGPNRGAASLFYLNIDEEFQEFARRDLLSLNPDTRLVFAARNGATTHTVMGFQLSNLPPNIHGTTLITMTIGGNDVLKAIDRQHPDWKAEAGSILKNIQRIIAILQTTYPGSMIIVGTIYDPTDGVGDLYVPGVALTEGLTILAAVNEGIRAIATQLNVHLADIHRHFLGHGYHHDDPANGHYHPDDPSLWFTARIEPNARGASEIRRLFWEALQAALEQRTRREAA